MKWTLRASTKVRLSARDAISAIAQAEAGWRELAEKLRGEEHKAKLRWSGAAGVGEKRPERRSFLNTARPGDVGC